MKTTQFAMFACALTLFAQPMMSAHAGVVVAPADRSATALQNSGATYDHNDRVTTSAERAAERTQRATATTDQKMNNASRMSNHRVAQDHVATPVTHVDSNSTTITQDGVAMNSMPDQQQQQVAPTHSATPWLLFLLAIIVGGAIYYTSKKRDLPARGRY